MEEKENKEEEDTIESKDLPSTPVEESDNEKSDEYIEINTEETSERIDSSRDTIDLSNDTLDLTDDSNCTHDSIAISSDDENSENESSHDYCEEASRYSEQIFNAEPQRRFSIDDFGDQFNLNFKYELPNSTLLDILKILELRNIIIKRDGLWQLNGTLGTKDSPFEIL